MLEPRKPIPPELMEALIRYAHHERAATVAAMLKRIPFLVAGAFQSLLCLTVRKTATSPQCAAHRLRRSGADRTPESTPVA